MARPTKEESILKQKAVEEALEILKEQSHVNKNLVTYDNIVCLANESEYAELFKTPIGVTTVKQPTQDFYREFKKKIKKFKRDIKEAKQALPNKTKDKIKSLEKKMDNMVMQMVDYQEKIHDLQSKLSKKDELLERTERERDEFASIVANSRISHEA